MSTRPWSRDIAEARMQSRATTSRSRPLGGRELSLVVALCTAIAALHLGIAGLHHSLGVSRNDDWTYYRIAFEYDDSGQFRPDPYTRTMLWGQIQLARPVMMLFGQSITALQVVVCILGSTGLFATFAIIRRFLPFGLTAFSVGLLALGPIYGTTAVSYMSDVPSFAVQAFALWAGVRALESPRRPLTWIGASLGLALIGFSIREYAVGAALSVAVTFLVLRGGNKRRSLIVIAASALWLMAAIVFFLWRKNLESVEGADHLTLASAPVASELAVRTVLTMIALLAPAVVLLWARRPWRRPLVGLLFVALLAVALVRFLLAEGGFFLLGNYLTWFGSYPEASLGLVPRSHPVPLSTLLSLVFLIAACTIGAVLVGSLSTSSSRLWGRWRCRNAYPPALTLSLVFGCATVLIAISTGTLSGGWLADRYLIAAVPFLGAALVWHAKGQPLTATLAWALFAPWAILGLHQIDVAATSDGVRWEMATVLQRDGYSPETIDTGLEWFGLHQPGPVIAPGPPQRPHLGFWLGLFENPRVCVVAAFESVSPTDDKDVVRSLTEYSLLGVEHTLVARAEDLGCAQ